VIPVRTNRSNFVYRGPTPDIGDAWVERRRPGEVYMTWVPSDEEREAIAAGGLIELGIYGREPISPVSLGVAAAVELSVAGAALRDRAFAICKDVSPASSTLPSGHWLVATDVWQALCAESALDTSGTSDLPVLFGRPLMEVPEASAGTFEYAVAVAA
jgi:hypothetical protein